MLETSHMLSSQQHIFYVQAYEIELALDSGLRQKASFDLLSIHAGGRVNIGFTWDDAKSYLKARRARNIAYEDVGTLIQYFQKQSSENHLFFHAYQLDADEHITNVFWVDVRILIDYRLFDDVVSLDTTFGTNKKNMSLAVFCELNHHKRIVIFGAALLFDEIAYSFNWFFQTLLQANGHKKPLTIFTNQDSAMAKALFEVMPNMVYGLCTWHLMRNAMKHLAQLPGGESHILTEIRQCMYGIIDEDLFEAWWNKMVEDHDVKENQWITNAYLVKQKWAAYYMKRDFTLGVRSTQISESLNSDFKDLLNPIVDLVHFFKLFERIVEEKCYKELKCEYDSREKMQQLRNLKSLMLKHLSDHYTLTIFEMFQQEFDSRKQTCIKGKVKSQLHIRYVIFVVGADRDYILSFDLLDNTITCSCCKFESIGILCCHALKVYE